MENQPLPTPTREKAPRESGYSETEQAKAVEGSTLDVKQARSRSAGQVKKRKPSSSPTQQEKILLIYQTTHQQIMDLLVQVKELQENLRHQEKIVEEIRG